MQNAIITFGYIGVFGAIFAETGLLVGFFLPGDSLLFTAGIFAAQGHLNLGLLLFGATIAAIVGDSTGYYLGRKFGRKVFTKESSWLFNKSHLKKTEDFYKKYGQKTIILARFVPIVRTGAATCAGMADMPYLTFLTYNVIGAVLWVAGFILAGYYLGRKFPTIENYMTTIILLIIAVSVLPIIYNFLKRKINPNKSSIV